MTKLSKGNVAAVIPAFNESARITEVVEGVKRYALPIVVDDGSSDTTGMLAMIAGALVVRHELNLGYDAALQSGLFKAIDLKIDYAVTLDADGQHNPCLLMDFINELSAGADVVVGSRGHHQRISEVLMGCVGRTFWGMPDPLCGMKGYRLSHMERLGFFDSYQSIGTEYTIRCIRSGLVLKNIPLQTNPRDGLSRFGVGWKANYKILRSLMLAFINARAF